MSFFGVPVNPFSTPVGQRIEQATDGSLPSENWALNMEICDIINETEDGPRDAVKAIRRRLNQAAGKNYTIVMYTLTVLETCVKNCGKCFHALACSREFVLELVKLIGPKNEPPTAVQEKVLSLIQAWAETFRHQPHTQGVVQVYQELKQKGIEFPMTDLDAMAPIITPQRKVTYQSVPESEQTTALAVPPVGEQPPMPLAVQGSNVPAQLTEPQLAKLQSELDVVQGNMRVLAEMLTHLTNPNQTANQQPDPADLELLTELHSTCKAMQERVVELIGKLAHDEMTAELLRVNDELNNLFLRYTRYTKNKATPPSTILAQTIGQPPNNARVNAAPVLSKREAESLIDLSDGTDSLGKELASISVVDGAPRASDSRKEKPKEKEGDNDEFDMFAQSRTATYETTKNSGSRYEDNAEQPVSGGSLSSAILNRNNPNQPPQNTTTAAPATVLNQESEFNEMAAWLDRTPGAQGDQESLTSFEFERFLAERAAAAEALPTIPPTTTATTTNTNAQRQINKDQDKSLFAL
ncbi:TOM1-like protein 2 isoform X1 [Neodiprion pinetum]|uniref:TOM1-like protein 2 isoform X1 n=2 Tax=Neodiprion TaxID=270857 RepID=UPI001EDD1EB0|nr:TOM1-like protein 2 isoform X1 [Neodiprion pinetum]XP_046617600.1 TOM1-like protein 2 isoform X1 [Neodiprion virginianus]XP_046617601.1 TOM1-like protein 2 isoform X1 [Neodiprion virginianus]